MECLLGATDNAQLGVCRELATPLLAVLVDCLRMLVVGWHVRFSWFHSCVCVLRSTGVGISTAVSGGNTPVGTGHDHLETRTPGRREGGREAIRSVWATLGARKVSSWGEMAGLHDIKLGRVARSDRLWDGGRGRSSAMVSYLYHELCW